ncbi:MAG: hypothetical protein Kow00114_14110 [Kiloniellaceae bacterium]
MTKPRSQADKLLAADETVEEVIWLERAPGRHDGPTGLWRLARLLRAGRFQRVWVLHGSARLALACCLAGIPERIGFGLGWQRRFLTQGPVLPAKMSRAHTIEKADRLLALHGVAVAEDRPRLPVTAAERLAATARLADVPKPWVSLGIGSSEPFKQWGEGNFLRLAVHIAAGRAAAGLPPAGFVVVGGPAERAMGESLVAQLRERGIAVLPALALPLREAISLAAAADVYVGNDTGFLNIAAAVGTPALGLFGGSPPLRNSALIHALLPERPEQGMQGIRPETVAAHLVKLLSNPPAARQDRVL